MPSKTARKASSKPRAQLPAPKKAKISAKATSKQADDSIFDMVAPSKNRKPVAPIHYLKDTKVFVFDHDTASVWAGTVWRAPTPSFDKYSIAFEGLEQVFAYSQDQLHSTEAAAARGTVLFVLGQLVSLLPPRSWQSRRREEEHEKRLGKTKGRAHRRQGRATRTQGTSPRRS